MTRYWTLRWWLGPPVGLPLAFGLGRDWMAFSLGPLNCQIIAEVAVKKNP